jgi:hypothetical protein
LQKVKITNKNNGQDLWDVSQFMLEDGVQKSLLEAIKQNLGLENPKDLQGIEKSLRATFTKMRDEAVHVDKPTYFNKNHTLKIH